MPATAASTSSRSTVAVLLGLVVAALVACAPEPPEPPEPPDATSTASTGGASATATPSTSALPVVEIPAPQRLPGVSTSADLEVFEDPLQRWDAETNATVVQVTSTADGAQQSVLWDPPASAGAPLIVHAHSWSSGFDQQVGIPVALWAESVGWGFLQPDFRGRSDEPAATGSDLTTQDIIDAIDFAVSQGVDTDRVYLTGFSGGGMMSLLVPGRFPDRIAGVASWVPVYDLNTWYAYNRDLYPDRTYAEEIRQSCSGDPSSDQAARDSCAARSPVTVMAALRDADVPVYIGGGLRDDVVPVADALRAFNALAEPADRLPDATVDAVTPEGLPADVNGVSTADTRFTGDDPPVVFSRSSGNATVVVFDGGHEFVFYPGLDYLARLDAALQAAR